MGIFSEHLLLELLVGSFLIFIAPYVWRWRDRRAIAKGQKTTKKVKQHYSKVMGYALDPHALTQYLVLQKMLVVGAAVNMTVGMVWLVVVGIGTGSPALPNNYFRVYWNGMGFLIWILGSVRLTRLTTDAVDLWVHILSFDKYVGSVPAEFRNPELEQRAREKLKLQGAILA